MKVVQVGRQTDLADKITYRSNNQNPVDIRDQRSTDPVQRDLQEQMREHYGSTLFFAIREGERSTAPQVLNNKTAAQFLMAVYLKEPWNAVRKVRLFDTDYRRIFSHSVTAHRLFLVNLLVAVTNDSKDDLDSELRTSFSSIRFTLAFLIAQILRRSERGRLLLDRPQLWLPDKLDEVKTALTKHARDIVRSVNYFVSKQSEESAGRGEDFDPKVAFKSERAVRDLEHQVISLAERLAMDVPSYWFDVEPKG